MYLQQASTVCQSNHKSRSLDTPLLCCNKPKEHVSQTSSFFHIQQSYISKQLSLTHKMHKSHLLPHGDTAAECCSTHHIQEQLEMLLSTTGHPSPAPRSSEGSSGTAGGQQGDSKGIAKGQQRDCIGTAGGQQWDSSGRAEGQQRDSRGTAKGLKRSSSGTAKGMQRGSKGNAKGQ